jgi:hypothetical protein
MPFERRFNKVSEVIEAEVRNVVIAVLQAPCVLECCPRSGELLDFGAAALSCLARQSRGDDFICGQTGRLSTLRRYDRTLHDPHRLTKDQAPRL